MKTADSALQTLLYDSDQQRVANLYTFAFADGTQRWTTADTDITYSGNTWVCAAPVLADPNVKTAVGVEVATLDLELDPGALTLSGVSMKVAALRGAFNDILVTMARAYMSTWGTVVGAPVTIFKGRVDEVEPESTGIRLTVKALTARLEDQIPTRLIQPACPYQVYSTPCGANPASFSATRGTLAGSTAAVIYMSSSSTFANVGGWVTYTQGANTGLRRTIAATGGTGGTTLTLSAPFPSAPAEFDSFTVTRGCDKLRVTCRDVFSRIGSYGGFPDAPPPESAL